MDALWFQIQAIPKAENAAHPIGLDHRECVVIPRAPFREADLGAADLPTSIAISQVLPAMRLSWTKACKVRLRLYHRELSQGNLRRLSLRQGGSWPFARRIRNVPQPAWNPLQLHALRAGVTQGRLMIAAILSTGTELTRGELDNTNSSWIAAELTQLDVSVRAILTVDDNRERISDAFQHLASSHDLVVCTGGLGPTTDDVTAEALALAAGVALETHEPSLVAIRARLSKFGRALTDSNAKQARVPTGCTVMANPVGTAPGFCLQLGRATCFCVPGVPIEMRALFESSIAPFVRSKRRQACSQIVLRTFGMAESTVNDALATIETDYGVSLGYRVHFPELAVKVVALGAFAQEASTRAARAAEAVRARLGNRVVYGQGEVNLPSVLGQMLRERELHLGIAESCTGGLVSALLAEQAGVSDVFSGAVVAYSNDVKQSLLGVSRALIDECGAVSEPVAIAMAEGVRHSIPCDWALAITGIAGPTGATAEKPVGTVHFAVCGPNLVRHHHRVFSWDRVRVQRAAAFVALNWIRCLLLDPQAEPV